MYELVKNYIKFFFSKNKIKQIEKKFDKKKKNIIFQISTLYHFEIIRDLFISLKKEKKVNLAISVDHLDLKTIKYLKKHCKSIVDSKYLRFLSGCDIFIKTSYETIGPKNSKKILIHHGFPVKNTSIKKEYVDNIDFYFLTSKLEKKTFKFITKKIKKKTVLKEVGYTKLDRVFNKKRSKIFFKKRKKNIVYAPSWDKGTSLRFYGENIITRISEKFPDYNLFVKPHPASLETKKSKNFKFYTGGIEWEKKLKNIEKKSKNIYFIKDNLTELINICDILVTDISGAALEFIYFGKKVIFIDSPIFYNKVQIERKFNSKLSKKNLMFNAGIKFGFVVKSIDDLIINIQNKNINKNVKKFRDKYAYFNEGKSIQVAKKIILEN